MGWKLVLSTLAAGVVSAHCVQAQDVRGQVPARERTGPKTQAPGLPSYAVQRQDLAPPGPAPAPAALTPGAAVVFSQVRIDQGAVGFVAPPAKRWRPLASPGGGARIVHGLGENLDARWAHRQFVDNRLIGVETTPGRVVELILLINQAFIQNGYVNTGLLMPEQGWPARGAVLDLRLVAGRVVPLKAGGPAIWVTWANNRSRGLRPSYVRARMLAAARWPLNAIEVEKDFRLLADDPAVRTINAQLAPGGRPGEATLALTVDPQPRFDLYASFADSRSPSVGGNRAAVGGSIRNTAISGDVLAGEYGETSGLSDGSVTYAAPVFGPRTAVDVRAAFDDAAVVDPILRPLNIQSREASFEIGFSGKLLETPLTPNGLNGWSSARSLTAGIHLEHRRQTSTLLGMPFSFSPGQVDGRTVLTVLRGTIDWVQRGERQVIAAAGTVSLGLDGTGTDLPNVPIPNPHFTTVLAQLNYARRLGGGGVELRGRASGQWSTGLLYSSERLSVGGQSSVPGYRENLILADRGAFGSMELSCPAGVARGFCTGRSEDWRTVRLSVFAAGAVVHNAAPSQPAPDGLASVGVGLTWAPSNILFARFTYALALVKARIQGVSDLQDHGVGFEITLRPLALFGRKSR